MLQFLLTLLIIALVIYAVLVYKNKLKEVDIFEYKTPHIIAAIILILIFICTLSSISESKSKVNELESQVNRLTSKKESLEEKNKKLDNSCSVAREYLTLDENEKILVDAKIEEVKNTTKEAKQKEIDEKNAAEEKKRQEEAAALQAQKEAEEKARKEAEAKKYDTGITWEDMARDTNGRSGEYTRVSGKIIQVMNGTGYNQYRLAVDGDYNKVLLIEITTDKLTQNIIEDDYITVEGKCAGNVTYKTVLGSENTIPSLSVDNFHY